MNTVDILKKLNIKGRNQMKKNKTIAYMMAATLLIGGAGLGTKALFVDQGEAKGNDLVITMGNLNVDTKEGPWQMKSGKGTKITNQDAKNNFNNVKPGDSFEKTITVKNEGSLTQNIEVTGGGYKDSSKSIYDRVCIVSRWRL